MLGINLIEEKNFWEYVAEHNTFVQHNPTGTRDALDIRFAQYNEESDLGETSGLGFPRLELKDSPSGNLDANSAYAWDTMERTFRIITKLQDAGNFNDKKQQQQNCKTAALQIVGYIRQSQEEGTACNTIIKAFDTKSVSYNLVEYATGDDSYTGIEVTLRFKAGIDWEDAMYGPLPPYTNTFCTKVDECLNIPTANGSYVLKILNGVKSWIAATAGATWGSITGTLSNQTDLQNALNGKSNTGHSHIISDVTGLQTALDSKAATLHTHTISDVTGLATAITTAETNAKAYADTLVVGLIDDRGNYTPSGNYPSSGGSGTLGAILKGDLWTIAGLGSGVTALVGTKEVTDGDLVRALIDTPGQTDGNWAVTENNIGYVAENQSNKATSMTGNTASNTVYLSAKAVYDWVIGLGYITASALSGYATEVWVNAQGFITAVKTINGTVMTGSGDRCMAELLSTATASNSATIDFVLPNGYKSFEIRSIGVIPVTDNVGFWVRVSTDGGSTFAAGASDYAYQRSFQSGITPVQSLTTADSKIFLLGTSIGNGTGRYFNAIVRVWNNESSSQYKNITGEFNTYRSDSVYTLGLVNGVYLSNTAINAIRILLSSGNISTGTFELWGYK